MMLSYLSGGVAQFGRASDLHSEGQGFESPHLHHQFFMNTDLPIFLR